MTKKQSPHQAQTLPEISAEVQKELATLHAGEDRYRLLFETSPNALFLIGKDGHFLDVNQAALDWYGYSLQEFRNMTVADLAASRELSLKAVGRVQHAVQGPTRFEWRHRRKDGRELPVEINTTPVKIGGEACTFAIVSDITERKLAEESIHNSEQKYRMLFDSMRQGVFYQQADGSLSDVNPAALEMLGLSREQFLGRDSHDPAWRVVREDGSPLPGAEHPSMLALRTGEPVTDFIIGVFNPQKQSMVWMTINAVPEFLEGESAAHRVAVTLHDITGRKQAEEALRESEQRIRAVIDHAPYGAHLYELMPDQRLVFTGANRAADTILGVDHQQFIGKTIEEAFPPLVQSEVPGAYRIVAASGEPYETDQVDYDEGNIRGAFEVHAFQTGPNRMAAFFRDITERKQAEEALPTSEERYRDLFENSIMGVSQANPDGRLLCANAAYAQMYGYETPEKMMAEMSDIGQQLYANLEDRKEILRILNTRGVMEPREVAVVRRDGSRFWVLVSARKVIDTQGKLYYQAEHVDITERKRMETEQQALLEIMQGVTATGNLQEFLALVHGSLKHVIFAENFSVVFHNESTGLFEEVYAVDQFDAPMPPSELAKSITSYVFRTGEALIMGQAKFDELEAQGQVELVGTNSLSWLGAPLKTPGKTIGVMVVQDYEQVDCYSERDRDFLASVCTQVCLALERKENEKALRDSEDKFKYFFDHSVNGKSITQVGGEMHANQAFCDMLGYSTAELQGKKWQDISHPDDLELTQNEINALLAGQKETAKFTKRYLHKDGSVVWAEVGTALRRTADGKPLYFMTSLTDITARKQAEEAFRENEEKIRSIFRVAPTGIGMVKDRVLLEVNQCICEMTGYTREELVGKSARLLYPSQEEFEWVGREKYQQIAQKGSGAVETRWQKKDGSSINILLASTPLDGQDLSKGVTFTALDITERKLMEDTIRQNNELLAAFIRHSPIYAFIKEVTPTESRVLKASENYQEMIGIPGSAMIGKSMQDLFPAEQAAKFSADDWAVVSGGKVLNLGEELNGRSYTTIKFPILLGEKKLLAGYTIDITERKQAEELIKESEASYRKLAESLPGIVYRVHLREQGRMQFFNARVETLTGYKTEELVSGEICSIEPLILPEDRGDVSKIVTRAIKELRPFEVDYRLRRKDAEIRYFSERGNVIAGPDGKPLYIDGVIFDTTERKQIEEQIRQLNAELEQRVEERTLELREAQEKLVRQEKLAVLGQLAGGVGHELRNPLSVINNAIYLLKLVQADASPQVKEYLGIIDQETHTAEKIISDLLEFSRTKSVERGPVVVKDMFRQVLERFPAPNNVTVKFKLPADLPPVFADQRHMAQVFGNLTVNACQAMPEGGTLSLSAKKRGREIAISVTDTGTGITPENMKKLFEPLFTTKAKGIGLGLAVSRKLVEANEGRLEIQSEVGKGSTFTVTLPVHQEE